MKDRPLPACLIAALLALFAACAPGTGSGSGGPARTAPPEFEVTAFLQDGEREVRRDEALLVELSAPPDLRSLGSGSIRLVPRRGREPVPLSFAVEGSTLLLRPPEPFGFAPDASYYLCIDGFPSLDAPRDLTGRPLARRFRGRFRTSRLYGPDLVPPAIVSAEIREGTSVNSWVLSAAFSEPLEPESVRARGSIRVFAEPGGAPITGRWVHDRRAQALRFSPAAGPRPDAVRVEFTRDLTDLAGNPLADAGPRVLPVPPAAATAGDRGGEIGEDFTTTDHLDPDLTTALWCSARAPGVLLGDPATTERPVPVEGDGDEAGILLGQGTVRLAFLLSARDLGAPREITGLLLSTTGVPPAEYESLSVRVTPTLRAGIDDRGPDLGPPLEVCSRRAWRPVADEGGMVLLPLLPSLSHGGDCALLFEVTVGPGTHTTILRARPCPPEAGVVEIGGGRRALRPLLALRGFSLEPSATSLFFDSGLDAPAWLPPALSPAAMPPGVSLTLLFQGATQVGPGGRPPVDPGATSEFVEDVTTLSGYRYIRFRATFRGTSLTGEEAALDEIRVPFRARR